MATSKVMKPYGNSPASYKLGMTEEAQLARYSGEDFAVVLPDYDINQAQIKAEALRRDFGIRSFPRLTEKLPFCPPVQG